METTTTLKNLSKSILLITISFVSISFAQTPRLVKNIANASGSSSPLGMTSMGGKVYFRADDGTEGPGNNAEFWVTDGSYYGTKMVKISTLKLVEMHPVYPVDSRFLILNFTLTLDRLPPPDLICGKVMVPKLAQWCINQLELLPILDFGR
jgi:ELWxxDGT repeat protein